MVSTLSIKAYTWIVGVRASIVDSLKREDGQDLIEYAVLAGGIGIALFIVFLTAPGLSDAFDTFKTKIADCVTFDSAGCTT